MRHSLCVLLVFIGVLSCTNNRSSTGLEATLNEEQFIAVYEEILVTENYYQSKIGLPNLYKVELEHASKKIFLKHHTTKKQFEESFEFYAKDPKSLRAIQEKIIDRLNKKKL
jgi:uncharacterized membrane protein